MDSERQSTLSNEKESHNITSRPIKSLTMSILRAGQNLLTTLSLIYIACAIDRNILTPGVTIEEKLVAGSAAFAFLITLYHFTSPGAKRAVIILDLLAAALLLVTLIFTAVQVGEKHGACKGPKKIGVWDNSRGCKRVTSATVLVAIDFLFFAATGVMTAMT